MSDLTKKVVSGDTFAPLNPGALNGSPDYVILADEYEIVYQSVDPLIMLGRPTTRKTVTPKPVFWGDFKIARCIGCKLNHTAPFCCTVCGVPHSGYCKLTCVTDSKGFCSTHSSHFPKGKMATTAGAVYFQPDPEGPPSPQCAYELGLYTSYCHENMPPCELLTCGHYKKLNAGQRCLICANRASPDAIALNEKAVSVNAVAWELTDKQETLVPHAASNATPPDQEPCVPEENPDDLGSELPPAQAPTEASSFEPAEPTIAEAVTSEDGDDVYGFVDFFADPPEPPAPGAPFPTSPQEETTVETVWEVFSAPEGNNTVYVGSDYHYLLDLCERRCPDKEAAYDSFVELGPSSVVQNGPLVSTPDGVFRFSTSNLARAFVVCTSFRYGLQPPTFYEAAFTTFQGVRVFPTEVLFLLSLSKNPEILANIAQGVLGQLPDALLVQLAVDYKFHEWCVGDDTSTFLHGRSSELEVQAAFAGFTSLGEPTNSALMFDGNRLVFYTGVAYKMFRMRVASPLARGLMALLQLLWTFPGAFLTFMIYQIAYFKPSWNTPDDVAELQQAWDAMVNWESTGDAEDPDTIDEAVHTSEAKLRQFGKMSDITRIIANAVRWGYLSLRFKLKAILPSTHAELRKFCSLLEGLVSTLIFVALLKYAWRAPGKICAVIRDLAVRKSCFTAEEVLPELEPHAGTEVSTLHLLLFSLLAGSMGLSSNSRTIREMCMGIFGAYRAGGSVATMIQAFGEKLPECLQKLIVSEVETNDVTLAFRKKSSVISSLSILPPSDLVKPLNAKKFVYYYKELQGMSSRDVEGLPAALRTHRTSLLSANRGKLTQCELALKALDGNKPPFFIYMYGEPRIGKSVCLEALWRKLAVYHPECYDENGELMVSSTMYYKNLSESFYSGYNGQPCFVYDDLCSIQRPASAESGLIANASGTHPILEQPSIDNEFLGIKGQRFWSSLIFGTANSAHMTPNDVNNKEALNKRRQIAVKVVRLEEFKDVDWEDINGMEHLSFQLYSYVKGGATAFHGQPMTFEQFMDHCSEAYGKHIASFAVKRNVDAVSTIVEPPRDVTVLSTLPTFVNERAAFGTTIVQKYCGTKGDVYYVQSKGSVVGMWSTHTPYGAYCQNQGVTVYGPIDKYTQRDYADAELELSFLRFGSDLVPPPKVPEPRPEAACDRFFTSYGLTWRTFFKFVVPVLLSALLFWMAYRFFSEGDLVPHSMNKAAWRANLTEAKYAEDLEVLVPHGGRTLFQENYIHVHSGQSNASMYLVSGTSYVGPKHLFDGASMMTVRVRESGADRVYTESFKSENLKLLPDEGRATDICVYTFTRLPMRRDNRSSFADAGAASKSGCFPATASRMGPDGAFYRNAFLAYHEKVALHHNGCYTDRAVFAPARDLNYTFGDCGAVVCTPGPDSRVIGVYIGATQVRSIFYAIDQSFFSSLFMPHYGGETLTEHAGSSFRPECTFGLIGRINKHMMPTSGGNTKIKKSDNHLDASLCGPNIKQPAHLTTWRDGTEIRQPMTEAIARLSQAPELAPSSLPQTIEIMTQMASKWTPEGSASVLSYDEALHGVLGSPHLNGVDLATAPGFPEMLDRPSSAPQHAGKRFLVDGDCFTPAFLERCESIITSYKSGELPLTSYVYGALKDELLPTEKAKIKTRLIYVCSSAINIVAKRYFGAFCAAMIGARGESPIQVGINVHSLEFNDRIERLQRHPNLTDKDHKSFDTCCEPARGLALTKVVNAWYAKYDLNCTEEDDLVREMVMWNLYHCPLIFKDAVFNKNTSLVSGHQLTTMVGSLMNLSYEVSLYLELVPDRVQTIGTCEPVDIKTLWYFERLVAALIYNDDSASSCADVIAPYVTFEKQREWFSTYGRTVTDGAKTGRAVSSIEDISFLKKKPIKLGGVWVPKADPDTLCGMWHWYRAGGLDQYAQMTSNANDILRMKFFEGSAEFHRCRNIISRGLRFSPELITHTRLVQKWEEGHLEVSSFPIF